VLAREDLRLRETRRVFDLFGLPQMPPIVRRDHEESGGNAESDEREEWIPEPRVIGIDRCRADD